MSIQELAQFCEAYHGDIRHPGDSIATCPINEIECEFPEKLANKIKKLCPEDFDELRDACEEYITQDTAYIDMSYHIVYAILDVDRLVEHFDSVA